MFVFFFSSRRRHTRWPRDWSSDVCSSDLFHGFYGTNITEVDLMDRIRNIFYTKEQLSRQIRLLPNPIRNISIDKNGYVYTVSNDEAEQIKKLNIRGANQWTDFQYEDNINLRFLGRNESEDKDEESEGSGINITGITVDENGIVTDRKSVV